MAAENLPATRQSTVADLIQSPQFVTQLQRALPRGGLTAERLARVALTEMRRTPKLMECSQASLMGSIMVCAQLGLEPGPMGLAYLIPYENRKLGTVECSFQLGYRGLLALLWRSEAIASIQSEVVCANDVFDYDEGSNAHVRFKRLLTGDRGEKIGVFAAISLKGGGVIVRVMSVQDVEEHRARYSRAGSGPWDTAWDEMAAKTILKRAAKRAPISTETQLAISEDDRAEYGPIVETTASHVPEGKAEDPLKAAVAQKAKAANGRKRRKPIELADEPPPPEENPSEAQQAAQGEALDVDPAPRIDSPQKIALEALQELGLHVRPEAVEQWTDFQANAACDYAQSVQAKLADPTAPGPRIPRFVESALQAGTLL